MQTRIYCRSRFTRPNYIIILITLILTAFAVAAPFYSSRAKSKVTTAKGVHGHGAGKSPGKAASRSRLTLGLPVQETITTFAADCTTQKSTFNLGETVCAKTDNVDLNWPGGRWVDWILTGSPNTIVSGSRTTTLITTNPQTFTYAPTSTGTYKVEITQDLNGQDDPQTPAVFTVVAGPDTAGIYEADCVTPATSFNLGDTVCAKITGAPLNSRPLRRLSIETPTALIAAEVNVTSDPQTLVFTLPSDASTTYGDTSVDNRGGWQVVNSSGIDGTLRDSALFYVHDPQTPVSDLVISKTVAGNTQVSAGSNVVYTIIVKNYGPDAAASVAVNDQSPANTTFVLATQDSGPTFNCTHPTAGETGTSTCTLASLAVGASAEFSFVYKVDTGTAVGTTISNTATISSTNTERFSVDNSATVSATVANTGGGGGGSCTVACPDDITTPANTVDQNNNPGAIVHFSPPSGNEDCGNVTADHCNDCFFPEGTTVVTATSTSGDTCSFTVTVTASGSAPTITCPGNKTGNADSNCQASFSLGTAAATGQNVTVVAFRSDGLPVYTCDEFGNCTRNSSDAPFNVGQTTVTWYAYAHDIAGPYTAQTGDEESHRSGSATCTQIVTVNDVTPPTIAATNQTIAADSSCSAVVPDYSSTVSDNCACSSSDTSEACQNHNDIAYSQTPAAGTPVGLGSYTIHIEANDGTNNATKDITLTVADQTAPQISCPANITRNTDPGTCSASGVNPGTATATDNCDTTPTIVGTRSDNQPLNASYPKGTTTIHWTATDDAGNTSSCDQTVTVEDHEAPTISCPANIVLEPTCPSGAIATWTAPVGTDNCPGATTARTAGGAPGSVFPIGTTTVTYTVTDASNNSTSCSFTVTVKTVAQTINDMKTFINSLSNLSGVQKQGLNAKLDQALSLYNGGQTNAACNKLADFNSQVSAYINNGTLTSAQGNALLSSSNHVRNTIGCTNNPCT